VRSWKRRSPQPRPLEPSPPRLIEVPSSGVRPRVLLAFAAMWTLSAIRIGRALRGHEVFGAEAYLALAALVVAPGVIWDFVGSRIARWRAPKAGATSPVEASGSGTPRPVSVARVIDLATRRPRSV
jgi:hypothetical protein